MGEYDTQAVPDWCPGCGDYAIWAALKRALSELKARSEETLIVSGIGCSGKMTNWVRTYAFHGLHGRVLPPATGAKLANHTLEVIGVAGDGDAYGIGAGHFVHTCRRNLDMAYIVHNNQVYGLTTGQTSPTSEKGFKTKSTPTGSIEPPMNPLALAICTGATFVSRGYAGDVAHLSNLILEAVKHKGFALVDVLQPCVSFNKLNTYDWYKKRVYKLGPEHDPTDKLKAIERSLEWGERIPLGVFYREERSTYEDELPQITEAPLAKQTIENIDIAKIIGSFI